MPLTMAESEEPWCMKVCVVYSVCVCVVVEYMATSNRWYCGYSRKASKVVNYICKIRRQVVAAAFSATQPTGVGSCAS